MSRSRRLLLWGLLLLAGCRGGPVQQETDRVLLEMATHPFDPAPPQSGEDKKDKDKTASAKMPANAARVAAPEPETDVQTVALMQAERPAKGLPTYQLTIPTEIPGSEAVAIDFFQRDKQGRILRDKDGQPLEISNEEKLRRIERFYPELEALQEPPTPESGPNGVPYTLADLQKLAVENSPTLRQAVSDVEAAKGALVQARTYQNPTIAYQAQPTNNNSNAGAQGGYIDQPIKMFGKMKLQVAAAQKSVDNAVLALRRARSDLSSNVRNAYFTLIVAKETMRVNQSLAHFTDQIYRLYVGYLKSTIAAPYEPAPLRAQSYTNRLAYVNSIQNYIYAWKQLVATLGLPQLPLTEVSGPIDRLIPYYDYDKVLAYILANHTDVLTARNGVQIAQYNLRLAQITPLPDVDLQAAVWKESTITPYVIFYAFQTVFPIPIWDQNKGNIKSAQAALIRAVEETHRVENALTTTLAANYANYRNNLYALENYRRHILPDQVRYYRGVFERRQADNTVSPSDLVTAQQALTTNVQTYLGILGSLWTAVVSVADLIQTPDLFQLAQPRELPELPDLSQLPRWLCPHGRSPVFPGGGPSCAGTVPNGQPALGPSSGPGPSLPPAREPTLPAPRQISPSPKQLPPAEQHPEAKPADLIQQLMEPPPDIPKRPGVPQTAGEPSSGREPSP
jgi:cobalt-zinc-cadmium efflux system outer membrane protein